MKSLLLGLFFIYSGAQASTFIGNGGSGADLEMQVALSQVQKIFETIQRLDKNSNVNICRCRSRFENQPSCEMIKKLDEQEVKFCDKTVKAQTPQILEWLAGSKSLKINWTSSEIMVGQKHGERLSDAVTNRSESTITVNQKRFQGMNPPEKMFLLVHELFHLTSFDNKPMEDEGPVGPFKGPDGGRDLINAMSAGAVMEGLDSGSIKKFQSYLRRSSYDKDLWIDLAVEGQSRTSTNNTYAFNNPVGGSLGVRYYIFNNFGVTAKYWMSQQDKGILTTIKGKEIMNSISLGLTYKLTPFSDPLSYIGQSHFVFNVAYEQMNSHYELTDPFQEYKNDVTSSGVRADVRYYLPIRWGFWGFVGAGASTIKYSYTDIPLSYDSTPVFFFTGVSYGFL